MLDLHVSKQFNTCIVTSADKRYLPGVKALYASFLENTPCVDFYLFAHGNEGDFESLKDSDIKILYNKDTIASPGSSEWSEEIPAMYSRLLIPRLLSQYDRVLWLDADVLILKDLTKLFTVDMREHAVAGQIAHRTEDFFHKFNYMPFQFDEPQYFPEFKQVYAIQSGVLLFDPKRWHEKRYDDAVDEALTSGISFKFVVQGLLGYVLKGEFCHIPNHWNAKLSTIRNIQDVSIIHYVGGVGQNPWEVTMPHSELWNNYYRKFNS